MMYAIKNENNKQEKKCTKYIILLKQRITTFLAFLEKPTNNVLPMSSKKAIDIFFHGKHTL